MQLNNNDEYTFVVRQLKMTRLNNFLSNVAFAVECCICFKEVCIVMQAELKSLVGA